MGSAEHTYRHGVVTEALPGHPEVRLPADYALQVPADYIDVLRFAIPEAVANAGIDPADVVGLGTDFTACTMVAATSDGTPLCQLDEFADRPHAYAKLWRHHAAQPQADRINALAAARGETLAAPVRRIDLQRMGIRQGSADPGGGPQIYAAIDRWVEGADWIVWQLTGRYVRNISTAGYKAIRQDGKYPSRAFLAELNPGFASFVEDKIEQPIGRLGEAAGALTAQAAA